MKTSSVGILSLLLMMLASPIKAVTIEGVLRDRNGNGLNAAVIEVYAMVSGQLTVVGRTISREEDAKTGKPQGYYQISVTSGPLIAAISYNHDAWQPRVVKDLSGLAGDNQVINKVLLDKQGPASFLPILGQIHEYEELYYLEQELAGAGIPEDKIRQKVRVKYEERIRSMPDPRRMKEQPVKQQEIVSRLTDEQRRVLARKMNELFSLYAISTRGDLRQSRWDTTYVAPGGQRSRAWVTINGQSGKYEIVQGERVIDTGQLDHVEINDDGKVFSIDGNWQLGKTRGYFRWTSKPNAPTSFEGEWGYRPNHPEGPWTGELILSDKSTSDTPQ